jgi:hypothetical protein
MSIKLFGSSTRRTTASPYNISQWTNKQSNLALYRQIADSSIPDMRGADNLLFSPKEMLSGTQADPSTYDPSYQAISLSNQKPIFLTLGAFVAFLILLRYLRS